MKTALTYSLLVSLLMIFQTELWGQKDLFKDLFEKEAPEFTGNFFTTQEEGVVKLVFYFSHNKIDELEYSIWMKDQGISLLGEGKKELVQELRTIRNRQRDTILLEGLTNKHFYTIGLDFRNPGSLNRKFYAKVIKEGYHYSFEPIVDKELVDKVIEKEEPKPTPEVIPCKDPQINIQVDESGYCDRGAKPAVMIQCTNCVETDWTFSVEVRKATEDWRSLRVDGQRQKANGQALRTEPFCNLASGNYFVRVLAWGNHCEIPVSRTLKTRVQIGNDTPIVEKVEEPAPVTIDFPDSCDVIGTAQLRENKIEGTLRIPAQSPCGKFEPYAHLTYMHPGHRNLDIEALTLYPAIEIPFTFELDEVDLNRGIHPIQVTPILQYPEREESYPTASFWINATSENLLAHKGVKEPKAEDYSISYIDTIAVAGGDPNCNAIQDMRLVYGSGTAEKPLYVSWLNPKCCQLDGCEYQLWAGPNPDKLRLVVNGRKSGAEIQELLHGLRNDDNYLEVNVKTENGTRKAAYVQGEGPLYGYEAILAYRDALYPADYEEEEAIIEEEPEITEYQTPKFPVSKFKPCKYQREITVDGVQPAEIGDNILIEYQYAAEDCRYTLYYLPEDEKDWVVAPGTEDLQASPQFEIEANNGPIDQYVILVYKPSKNWGCLSSPPNEPLVIEVTE